MQIAGFWQRIQAFIIDFSLLVLLNLLLEFLFYDRQPSIRWGGLIALITTTLYFGIFNSYFTHGKTIGKKLLQIKVVDQTGREIKFLHSLIRSAFLFSPFLLMYFSTPDFSFPWNFILSIAFTLIASNLYFYVINKNSRQSLHDWVFGTFVVSGEIRTPQTKSVLSKWHLLFPLIFLIFATILFCRVVPERLKKHPQTLQQQSP